MARAWVAVIAVAQLVRAHPALYEKKVGEVGSSNLPRPTTFGAIAQLGERLPCTQEVCGSIPHSSTKLLCTVVG
jgi:hypothetical protein